MIRESVDLALAGSNVKGNVNVPPDLWAVEVDSAQIVQVLHNVVLNARQAMPNGGVVQVSAENACFASRHPSLETDKYVRVSVQDTGCGIPAEHLTRIFDPYFSTKQSGHGLGLATAHSIVVKHHGQLNVHSTVGAGTTLVIDLPASEYTAELESVQPRPNVTGSGRILIMDDEEPIRTVLARALEQYGYEVEEAADGTEAIAKFSAALAAERRFVAVMLDMTVPGGVGGAQAAAELRRIDPSVRTILSSGYAEGGQMADYRQHGFDAVLPKPWTPLHVRRSRCHCPQSRILTTLVIALAATNDQHARTRCCSARAPIPTEIVDTPMQRHDHSELSIRLNLVSLRALS